MDTSPTSRYLHALERTRSIDKGQHTAARYVMNDYSWISSVTTMLNSLLLKCVRHFYSKLVMFYKIINNLIVVPSLPLIPLSTCTRGYSQHFRIPHAKINTHLYSFLPSTIKLWNNLPQNIVDQPSLNSFKNLLYDFL